MGALQSACPVRKTPGVQPTFEKKVEETVVAQSPSRSTKQFKGASLSKSAESFYPPGLSPSPEKVPATRFSAKHLSKAANTLSQPTVNRDDPEWAQYLQRKATEKYGPPQTAAEPKKPSVTQTSPNANFVLHTSEYLKLLKDGEGNKASEKSKALGQAGDKSLFKDTSMVGLKTDLAAALDSIIKTQQSNQGLGRKKVDALNKTQKGNTGGKGGVDVLARIAQMINKEGAEEEAEAETACVQDDILCERMNQDEDLAVPCYWSDDDQAPKAVKRASAHCAIGKAPGIRPRPYVTQELDDGLDHQVAVLLLHLRKLSDRQRIIEPGVSAKRRLVVGLKEVARSVRQARVKCVVVAPDIEEMADSGSGVDEKVREIVRECYKQDTPVVFALSRSRIGRAFGKSLRMSALAILDVTGVNDLYDNILEQSYAQRVAWLAKQPKPQAPWKAKAAAKAAMKNAAQAS